MAIDHDHESEMLTNEESDQFAADPPMASCDVPAGHHPCGRHDIVTVSHIVGKLRSAMFLFTMLVGSYRAD